MVAKSGYFYIKVINQTFLYKSVSKSEYTLESIEASLKYLLNFIMITESISQK